MGTARESQGPHEVNFGKTKCDRPAATVCCRPVVANQRIALLNGRAGSTPWHALGRMQMVRHRVMVLV